MPPRTQPHPDSALALLPNKVSADAAQIASDALAKIEAEKRTATHSNLLRNVEALSALLESEGDGSLSADQMHSLNQAITTVLSGVRKNVPRVADATHTPPLTVATSVVR